MTPSATIQPAVRLTGGRVKKWIPRTVCPGWRVESKWGHGPAKKHFTSGGGERNDRRNGSAICRLHIAAVCRHSLRRNPSSAASVGLVTAEGRHSHPPADNEWTGQSPPSLATRNVEISSACRITDQLIMRSGNARYKYTVLACLCSSIVAVVQLQLCCSNGTRDSA
jgi:hypothetical protein